MISLLRGAVWDFVLMPDGIFLLAYSSLSKCHANRQIAFAIIQENICSQEFVKRMNCEGGDLWKDAVYGFYCILLFIYSVCCLTTGPKPLPKRFLHIVQSKASSFK